MELIKFNEIVNNISKMDKLQKEKLYIALKNIVESSLFSKGHLN